MFFACPEYISHGDDSVGRLARRLPLSVALWKRPCQAACGALWFLIELSIAHSRGGNLPWPAGSLSYHQIDL